MNKLITLMLLLGMFVPNIRPSDNLIKLNLEKNSGEGRYDILAILENVSNDTLIILSRPFIIEGKYTTTHRLYPWPGPKYIVNVLYFEQEGAIFQYRGDADIRPIFNSIPKMFIIFPRTDIKIYMRINGKIIDSFSKYNFRFWLNIPYTTNQRFNKVLKDYPTLVENFNNSLINKDSFSVVVEDSLRHFTNNDSADVISNIIWDLFDKRKISNKNYIKLH